MSFVPAALRHPLRPMRLFTIGALLLACSVASGQDYDPTVEELDGVVIDFLTMVSYGNATATAFDDLLDGSQLQQRTEEVDSLVEETDRLSERYGKFQDAERIAAKRVGNDLVVMKYLYKCEYFPVVWYFTFYRTPARSDRSTETPNPWRVIIVRFDTELELLAFGEEG